MILSVNTHHRNIQLIVNGLNKIFENNLNIIILQYYILFLKYKLTILVIIFNLINLLLWLGYN